MSDACGAEVHTVCESKNPEPLEFQAGDGAWNQLRHYDGNEGKPPVLLLHGASAGTDTFRINEERSLVEYLHDHGFDVWMLDWRGSRNCVPKLLKHGGDVAPDYLTFDAAARYDLPAALDKMRHELGVDREVDIVAHCAGGCIASQAIAQGWIAPVRRLVLTTLGLFYRVAFDGWFKAQDFLLEGLLAGGVRYLDPRGDWDPRLERAFQIWKRTPLCHDCDYDFCHRVSYMFGMPYEVENIPNIHGRMLESQFGRMPMPMFVHGTQNIRRGWVGRYHADFASGAPHDDFYLQPQAFAKTAVTLITGARNQLWHRDSVDRMHEWLLNAGHGGRVSKHVLPRYGHQDLLWGRGAVREVFPLILQGLEREAPSLTGSAD